MERDVFSVYPGLEPAPGLKDHGILFYGHYSMCWFFECVAQPWSAQCANADVHSDPGALYIFKKKLIIYLMIVLFSLWIILLINIHYYVYACACIYIYIYIYIQ